jgi:tryptophanyl-tRNA synthetase
MVIQDSHSPYQGRILTGHRPTGPRHIGHLVGTLETWVRLQDTHQCFFLIADLHVLTTDYEHPQRIPVNVREVLVDWLAAGIDPEKSVIVQQSRLPEHAQLEVLFSMLVTVARLTRVPTYKEQQQQLSLKPSLGLLAYPVLQSADILLYRADTVPVGEDQLPHVELTREVARRFNQLYGEFFAEPNAILSATPRLPGIDNRAMHTSYGNVIALKESPEHTTRKIMQMYTDPTRIHASDPGHVDGNPVFTYLDAFDPEKGEVEEIKERYRQGKIGDVEIKKRLAEKLNTYLAPLRQRRAELENRSKDLEGILCLGTERARPIAHQTLEEVQRRMGLLGKP